MSKCFAQKHKQLDEDLFNSLFLYDKQSNREGENE